MKFKDRAQETSSNTPGASGTVSVSLNGATTNNRTFLAAGYATSDRVLCHIFQTSNPALWVDAECTFTDATPDTLTFTAADVHDGSSGAGTLPTWTSTVTAGCEATAKIMQRLDYQSRAFIEFDDPFFFQYLSNTSVRIVPGKAVVNGKLLEWTSNLDLSMTSGVAPLAAANVGYVYLYDNAGTPTLEGSTTAPEYNAALGYWRKTGDSTRRCVGSFFTWATTAPAYRVAPFGCRLIGQRQAELVWDSEYIDASNEFSAAKLQILGSGTATSATSVTLTPIAAHATAWQMQARLGVTTSGDEGTAVFSPVTFSSSITNRNAAAVSLRITGAKNAEQANFSGVKIPIRASRTAYYSVANIVGTGVSATVFAYGQEFPL